MKDNLKIEYVQIDSIVPYENNAKLHPAEQIEQIKESIKQFGMNDPIGVWHDEVVEGHGRLIALKELGYDNVPIIRLDDMTDEQRKAYMLVHNQLTLNSGWDEDLLSLELQDIDIDMEQFGLFQQVEEEEEEKEKPEIEFTEVLNEKHNYLVLYFDNEVDWLQLMSIIDIKQKKCLSTRTDGKPSGAEYRLGLGRVMRGAEVIEKIRRTYENID